MIQVEGVLPIHILIMIVITMIRGNEWVCNDTGGGWPKFWDKKDGAAKKLTDDDRNAFAATDAEQIVMMMIFVIMTGHRCDQ